MFDDIFLTWNLPTIVSHRRAGFSQMINDFAKKVVTSCYFRFVLPDSVEIDFKRRYSKPLR